MHRIVAAVVLLACSAPALARPCVPFDSWAPYGEHRAVDATGRYYVVVRARGRIGEPASFVLVERAPGASAARDAANTRYPDPPLAGTWDADAGVSSGDRVLVQGELPHAPLDVHVLAGGAGFVAVEKYGNLGYGKSVVAVGADGRVRFTLELADLFDARARASFSESVSSIHWLRGSWIDDARKLLVLATETRFRLVDLDTGSVSEGSEVELVRALDSSDASTQELAIELARERGMPGLDERLVEMFDDASRAVGVRLRAGLALAAAGDRRGGELFLAVARDSAAGEARAFAVRNLPTVLESDAALSALRELLRDATSDTSQAAAAAFADLGAPAVPTLIAILKDPSARDDSRTGAAYALGRIGAPAALPVLLAAIEDERDAIASAAFYAALAIDADSIGGRLADILTRGSTQDAPIAAHFARVRHPRAQTALRAALVRHAPGSPEARAIRGALAFQSGEDESDR